MRVLLVEDDVALAEGIRMALKPEGYTVDWLQDGVSALHALQQESFQMDQKMADFRKEIPASMGVGVAAAKNYAGLLAADLVATENQITQAQGQLKDAEMILAQIQKDIGMIKAKSAE